MTFRWLLQSILAVNLGFAGEAFASALANEPLITASVVPPNILLLLDSSGSMNHIVEQMPYEPNITYFSCPSHLALAKHEVTKPPLVPVSTDVLKKTSLASSVTFNTNQLTQDSAVFKAQFNTQGWTGDLLKYRISEQGELTGQIWQAAALLDNKPVTERFMFTYNSESNQAVPFRLLTQLSSRSQDDLNQGPAGVPDHLGQERINYLRGDKQLEGKGFRERQQLQADIVHASPIYVGKPESGWPDSLPFPSSKGSRYSDFQSGPASTRTPMIYLGDNGGLLQGFEANSGELKLSYLPEMLFSSAPGQGYHQLTNPAYPHRFYVDLAPAVQDAYTRIEPGGSKAWHTVLVGGLRAGGKGYFALNVTDPSLFDDSKVNLLHLWQFDESAHPDLGFSYAKPVIGLMNNGRWAAIVTSGYHESTGVSEKIFILFLDGGLDGTWTEGIDYEVLDTQFISNKKLNGLSAVAARDLDGNRTIDRLYTGDLDGNLWVFDVSKATASQWHSAYGNQNSPMPLFQIHGEAITTAPVVTQIPSLPSDPDNEPNYLVLFGTGQYLANTDLSNTDPAGFYAVWDHSSAPLVKSNLTEQTIMIDKNGQRVLSHHPVPYHDSSNSQRHGWRLSFSGGERVITKAVVRHQSVFFTTLIPDITTPCSQGGSGWIMAVNLLNGGEPAEVIIDTNNDKQLTATDKLENSVVSGIKMSDGIPLTPLLRSDYLFVPNSEGAILSFKVKDTQPLEGRIAWHDLPESEVN